MGRRCASSTTNSRQEDATPCSLCWCAIFDRPRLICCCLWLRLAAPTASPTSSPPPVPFLPGWWILAPILILFAVIILLHTVAWYRGRQHIQLEVELLPPGSDSNYQPISSKVSLMSSLRAGLIANDHLGSGPEYPQYSGAARIKHIANSLVDVGTLVCLVISYGITVTLGTAESHLSSIPA